MKIVDLTNLPQGGSLEYTLRATLYTESSTVEIRLRIQITCARTRNQRQTVSSVEGYIEAIRNHLQK